MKPFRQSDIMGNILDSKPLYAISCPRVQTMLRFPLIESYSNWSDSAARASSKNRS